MERRESDTASNYQNHLRSKLSSSLKFRVTFAVFSVFIVSIWGTLFYISQTLTAELKSLLEVQQYSATLIVANNINQELTLRLDSLRTVAHLVEKSVPKNSEDWGKFIDQKPVLQSFFNGGLFFENIDGVVMTGGTPLNDLSGQTLSRYDRDIVSIAIDREQASIGRTKFLEFKKQAIVAMATPVKNKQGQVIGAVSAVINLSVPNFLTQITDKAYAKTGSYFLVDPDQRLILAATNRKRLMERLPEPGKIPEIDWALKGNEGSVVGINPFGKEQLMAVKTLPISGWVFAIVLPTEEAFAPIYAMQRRLLLIGLIASVVIGFVIRSIVTRQLAPISRAAEFLTEISHRNDGMHALPVVRNDEVGRLIIGFNQLMTEVSLREAALSHTKAELEGTLNAIPDLLFECDIDGYIYSSRIHYCNSPFGETKDLIGKYFSDVLPKKPVEILLAALQQAQEDGHGSGLRFQISIEQDLLWFELSVAQKPSKTLADLRFVVLVRDVSENINAQIELKKSRDELRALANQLQNGREEQRAHLAREIHDVLAQELTRLKIDLSWMKRRMGEPLSEASRENLLVRTNQAMALVDSSITTVQRIATELRPVILDSLGLYAAIEWQVEDFAQRTGLACRAEVPEGDVMPSREISIALFRILQESLTNIARHANAMNVLVVLVFKNDDWILSIHDDGIGITSLQITAPHSLGLLGMYERALAIGGDINVEGASGVGTIITVRVPTAGV